jgi:urea transport system substrate-binding protein
MLAWGGTRLKEHYAVWSYFQSLPEEENQRFVAAWQKRFGSDHPTSDPVEAAYVGTHLWARAVHDVGASDPERVSPALLRQSIRSPSGIAAVDAGTRHLWKTLRIGKVRPDGQFDQVLASSEALRPTPWPNYRSREAWNALLETASQKMQP